ncbi:guanine nucleotide-binding protein subunit gamma 1-like [Papaver somniferum]|uniref:guanine nucleotide-binding protein subunit gamma 1-like n=1 Tax=Papaver somniferum TaxID=3469 RepID=UPI000E702FE4|nr:guanine nucleotide-binding protein subunit gamma 1-like [Papaver somniferum]
MEMEMEMERRGMEMDSENHQVGSVLTGDTRGKHRILAELKRLEQETRSLEEELEELEKTEKVSAACRELLLNVDARPDPLLPEMHGPANPFWDRWFEGPPNSQGCRCWVL